MRTPYILLFLPKILKKSCQTFENFPKKYLVTKIWMFRGFFNKTLTVHLVGLIRACSRDPVRQDAINGGGKPKFSVALESAYL